MVARTTSNERAGGSSGSRRLSTLEGNVPNSPPSLELELINLKEEMIGQKENQRLMMEQHNDELKAAKEAEDEVRKRYEEELNSLKNELQARRQAYEDERKKMLEENQNLNKENIQQSIEISESQNLGGPAKRDSAANTFRPKGNRPSMMNVNSDLQARYEAEQKELAKRAKKIWELQDLVDTHNANLAELQRKWELERARLKQEISGLKRREFRRTSDHQHKMNSDLAQQAVELPDNNPASRSSSDSDNKGSGLGSFFGFLKG